MRSRFEELTVALKWGAKCPSDWDALNEDDKAEMIAHHRVQASIEAIQIANLSKPGSMQTLG